jgi:putative ABC transport system permease protein
VLLSHRFWQRHFNADPRAIGQALTLNGDTWLIVGVLPPGFKYRSADIELWTPLSFSPETLREGYGSHSYDCVARLKPSVTLAQAAAEMNAINARLAEDHQPLRGWGINLVPMQEVIVGNSRRSLLVLLGAVGFLLLIACGNVANLLLARTASRSKEFAIRAALGAARRRVIAQILTESTARSAPH